MKRIIVGLLLLAGCLSISAGPADTQEETLVTAKSRFSLNAGFVSDFTGGQGYSACITSATFLGDSPWYYGFGSLFGECITTKENFFETGIVLGYSGTLDSANLSYDLFFDFLVTGGRISAETSLYQAEAPALHLGISLGFPASSPIDAAITIAPVIRPYNLQTQSWDFSRSYITLGIALQMKSKFLGYQQPWQTAVRELQKENTKSIEDKRELL